jgi:phosphoribosylanthranilate isomerase
LRQVRDTLVAAGPRWGTRPPLKTLHYNSRDKLLMGQIDTLIGALRPQANAIQLNVAWPDAEGLRLRKRSDLVNIAVILQVGQEAYEAVGREPAALAERLRAYVGGIDYVLYDMSGGTGQQLDLAEAKRVVEALQLLPFGVAVAGGLNAEMVPGLAGLLAVCPQLSWDAQSGLRDADDQLDLKRCQAFLKASFDLLASVGV